MSSIRWIASLLVVFTSICRISDQAAAVEGPWSRLNLIKDVEADPNKDYELTQDQGPWMIMAASFGGEGGREQARAVMMELRQKFKYEAYIHTKVFDYTESIPGIGVDRFNKPKVMKHRRAYKDEEVAVLVGNYPSIDDPQAQRDLEKIKYIYPNALRPSSTGKTNQQLAWWHNIQRRITREGGKEKPKGPMGRAWIVTNPTLPNEFFVTPKVDDFVVKVNKGVEFSLLDCKGKYTVQVATYGANVVIDQSKIKRIEHGELNPKSSLMEAAEKAHKVCEKLRSQGYEAYEFHDRQSSIVTIGSFDSVGTPREDGKTEINPNVHKIMQAFAAMEVPITPEQLAQGIRPGLSRAPRTVDGIGIDLQPMPVVVPKRSFSSSFLRR
jgi:hypothetical protein